MSLIGIDIGGTRIKAGRVDGSGKLLTRKMVETPGNLREFKTALASLFRELMVERELPEAIGIGCKGIIDTRTTEVKICSGTFNFLEGIKLSDFISPGLSEQAPVYADNDARVALAGEV